MPFNPRTDRDKKLAKAQELVSEAGKFTFDKLFFGANASVHTAQLRREYMSWKTKVDIFFPQVGGNANTLYEKYQRGYDSSEVLSSQAAFERSYSRIIPLLHSVVEELSSDVQPTEKGQEMTVETNPVSKKMFVVHGHDEQMKQELELFLRENGFEPIVLHRQADEGQTIIEKLERHTDVGYAFILLSPDDVGYPKSEELKPDAQRVKEKRARQNVVFEWGLFVGKLSRKKVCCLYKSGTTLPSDLSGIVYKEIAGSIENAGYAILKELRAAGYSV